MRRGAFVQSAPRALRFGDEEFGGGVELDCVLARVLLGTGPVAEVQADTIKRSIEP